MAVIARACGVVPEVERAVQDVDCIQLPIDEQNLVDRKSYIRSDVSSLLLEVVMHDAGRRPVQAVRNP